MKIGMFANAHPMPFPCPAVDRTGVSIEPTDDRDAIWFMVADDAKDAVTYWDDEDGARVAAIVAEGR